MPYRNAPTGPACACHPAAPTVDDCTVCTRSVCSVCVSYSGWRTRCAGCAKVHGRRTARIATAIQAAIFTLICSTGLTVGFMAGTTHPSVEPAEATTIASSAATYILCSISSTR